MMNALNSIIYVFPTLAGATNVRASVKMTEFWRVISQSLYIASENLLDVLIINSPIEVTKTKI